MERMSFLFVVHIYYAHEAQLIRADYKKYAERNKVTSKDRNISDDFDYMHKIFIDNAKNYKDSALNLYNQHFKWFLSLDLVYTALHPPDADTTINNESFILYAMFNSKTGLVQALWVSLIIYCFVTFFIVL